MKTIKRIYCFINRIKKSEDDLGFEENYEKEDVEEMQFQSNFSASHIIINNPIIKDNAETKKEYLDRLNSYIRAGQWNGRKFVKAELQAYKKIVTSSEIYNKEQGINYYKYYLLLDVMHILGYEIKSGEKSKLKMLKQRIVSDFKDIADEKLIDRIIGAFKCDDRYKKIRVLLGESQLKNESEYISLILKNIKFIDTKPMGILVTATMSAGKSTFINSLVGKYICRSQNMACTSKIHNIVNKAFEDGYSYEYDYELEMTAEKEELMNDNELNTSDKIMVGTHFAGFLSDHRIMISDSPGVNYSEDKKHKLITDKLIKGRNYHLLIYIMNATQLSTNDEDAHLDYVKRMVGRRPVLFVINKIDSFNIEEENFNAVVENQREYLKKKGFKNPMVCPISARAGYLSKRVKNGNLSQIEKRELYSYVDKFAEMGLPLYYEKNFSKIRVEDTLDEEEQLQKTSGLAYVEKIIISLIKGGR